MNCLSFNFRTVRSMVGRAAALGGLAGLCTAMAASEVLWLDNFNTTEPTWDVNYQINTRVSGSVGALPYVEVPDTAANGTYDDRTAVNTAEYPGTLALTAVNGGWTSISPNHSFIEGGHFSVEFDLDPGVNDFDSSSGDWAAIVLGATARNMFVNASDGFGILFRHNGAWQVFNRTAAVYGSPAGTTLPTGEAFHVKIDVSSDGFRGTNTPVAISVSVNGQPLTITSDPSSPTVLVNTNGFLANYITLLNYADAAQTWIDTFDNFQISGEPCVTASPSRVFATVGGNDQAVTVRIPKSMNASAPATVTLTSADPAVAVPAGAVGGSLEVTFAAGAAPTKTVNLVGVGRGTTEIALSNGAGVCVGDPVRVTVYPASPAVWCDEFPSEPFDPFYRLNLAPFETGSAFGQVMVNPATGIEFSLYADGSYWGGQSLATEKTFSASPEAPLTFEIDRVLHESYGTLSGTSTRSGVWITDQTRSRYVFFSYNTGEGGWEYNRKIGLADDSATGNGIDIPAFDYLPFEDGGLHRMKMVADGATVKLFLDGLMGVDVPFPVSDGIVFEFGAYTRAPDDMVTAIFDNLCIYSDNAAAEPCVAGSPSLISGTVGGTATVTIRVSAHLTATKPVTVTVTSADPRVATPASGAGGALTLMFPVGGPSEQTFDLNLVGGGITTLQIANSAGACNFPTAISVKVSGAFVRNPSFESNYNATWPSYSAIDNWDGGSGVNQGATGPFADNGTIPDGNRVGFKQGSGSVSQTISGLEPGKEYWAQIWYNRRNCCGDVLDDMTLQFEGVEIGSVKGVVPVGGQNPYGFRNFAFTPSSASGLFEIVHTVHSGDASLVFDAVTIVQRDAGNVVVRNPSFEASGELAGEGVLARIAGWTTEGTTGINFSGLGVYANNGANPDQDLVAFIRGPGALSQTILGLLPGQNYKVTFAYNAPLGQAPRLRVSADGASLLEVDVTPVGGSAAYWVGSTSFTAASDTAVLRFEQVVADPTQTVLLDDVKVTGVSINVPCIEVRPAALQLAVGETDSAGLTVSVPGELLQLSYPARVTVSSLNPAVARVEGAVGGVLTLEFPVGGDPEALSATVTVTGVSKGVTALQFANPHGVCFNRKEVSVLVLGSFVRNPSFEADEVPGYPGYMAIQSWPSEGSGNTGINPVQADGPFSDNGATPDRDLVALLQTSKIIRQNIMNLTPGKTYWLQFYYNVRNCCGGTIDLTASFDDLPLGTIAAITPVGGSNLPDGPSYYFQQYEFTPAAASGLLAFETTASGDATVLLDAITIVQRDPDNIPVVNPSFEASGVVPLPGTITKNIAGWTAGGAGNRGINTSGLGFADNGANPDQDNVAFLQGAAWLSQTITGLTPGQNYTVSVAVNASTGTTPILKISADGEEAATEAITPVGGSQPYAVKTAVFQAAGTEAVIRLEQVAGGDQVLLLDDVKVTPGGTLPVKASLKVGMTSTGTVRVSWPATAIGFSLQVTGALPGGWADSTAPVVAEGAELAAYIEPSANAQFFRLRK